MEMSDGLRLLLAIALADVPKEDREKVLDEWLSDKARLAQWETLVSQGVRVLH
jgi:hypothetical protein